MSVSVSTMKKKLSFIVLKLGPYNVMESFAKDIQTLHLVKIQVNHQWDIFILFKFSLSTVAFQKTNHLA